MNRITLFDTIGNDRKSHADLLIYKSEKMSLFDQKILEVAI